MVVHRIELLAKFNFVLQHRPGTKHRNANGLSRRAQKDNDIETGEKQEVGVIERTDVAVGTEMSGGAKEFFNLLGARGLQNRLNGTAQR